MANEVNYGSKKLLLWKETTKGVTPATIANAYSVKMLNFSLAESQKKETNPMLGNGGQASSTDYGSSDYSGNVECKYTGGIMPILLHHIVGAGTKTDATADAYAISTAYIAGDIVNGVVNSAYSFVCKTAGTTGGTEPTITTEVDGDEITDGTVVWILRTKLKGYTGSLKPCLETLGIESISETGCEVTPVTFKERYNGVFLNSFEIAKSNGTIIYKYSLPAIAMNRIDSENADFTEATITTETEIVDNAFGFDDLTMTVGGVELDHVRSFRLTVNRNTTVEDGSKKGEKIDNTPIPTVDGEIMIKFSKEQYTEAYNNTAKGIVMTFGKVNGDATVLTFPRVELQRSPLTYSTNEPIYISIPLNAYGDSTTATMSYSCVSATDY